MPTLKFQSARSQSGNMHVHSCILISNGFRICYAEVTLHAVSTHHSVQVQIPFTATSKRHAIVSIMEFIFILLIKTTQEQSKNISEISSLRLASHMNLIKNID
jgi:hypothetical protein